MAATHPRPGELPADRPLLEREPEIAAAAHAVDALCGPVPTGGALVYRGAAGLGKTALLARVRAMALDRCTVLTARGTAAAARVPFHVLRGLFGPLLAGAAPEHGDGQDGARGTSDARRLLGGWYDAAAPALGMAAPGDRAADPRAVRDGLDALAKRLTVARGPLVLLVDDAQWTDRETLGWLASFARSAGQGLPVLLVVAYRPEDAEDAADDLLAALGAAARLRAALRPLTADAAAVLAREALGPATDDAFCHTLWSVTEGNPYETVELLAGVRDSGLSPADATAEQLRLLAASAHGGALAARLEELGTHTVQFARAAAVLGTGTPLGVVAALAGMDRQTALTCARRLGEAHVLTAPDPVEFTRSRVAGAVYRGIPPATRTALHGRAAWVLTREGAGASAAAPHLLEVHPDDDAELVQQLREAAAEHLAVGAPDAARRCLERALAEPPSERVRAQVLYELGCAALLASPAATAGHLRASLGAPGLDTAQRADAVLRLAQALAHSGRTPQAAAVAAQELRACEPGPRKERLRAAHFLWEGVRAAEPDGAARSRRLAEATRGLAGRDNTERVLLMLRAFDATARGENAQEVVQIAERSLVEGGLPPGLGWTDTEWGFEPPALLGLSFLYADRLDRAEALFTEAVRGFEISGWSGGHLAFGHVLLGHTHRRRGRLAEAESYLREGLRLADGVGSGLPVHWSAASMLVDTLLARGHVEAAEEVAVRHGFGAPYPETLAVPDPASVRGRLLLALGRTREAVAELTAAGEALTARDRHNTLLGPWACTLARAVADDDPRRARSLAGYARRRAERSGTHSAIGAALLCAASLRSGAGAVALLEQAVAHLEASPCAYELACARVRYGVATGLTAELSAGLELAEQCGADGVAETARRALDAGTLRR
jgi:tetratricopeptide (TPR) repeat protein